MKRFCQIWCRRGIDSGKYPSFISVMLSLLLMSRAHPDLGNHPLNHYNCRISEGMTVKKIFVYKSLPSSTTSSWGVKLEELHPCNITRTACSPDAFIVPAAVPRYLYRLPKSPWPPRRRVCPRPGHVPQLPISHTSEPSQFMSLIQHNVDYF